MVAAARIVLAALVLTACSGEGAGLTSPSTTVSAPATTAATTTATSATSSGALQTLELGTVRDSRATVRVPPGTGSFLFSAVAEDLDVDLAIADVVGPDGRSAVPDASLLDNPAEVSVVVTAPHGLAAGDYVVLLEAPVKVVASAVLKPLVGPGRQTMDIRLWDVTKRGVDASVPGREKAEDVLRRRGEEILARHGLGVGRIDLSRAPAGVVKSSAKLRLPSSGTERRLRALCRAMASSLGPARALNVVLVDEILDRTSKDTELFGASAAIPGAVLVPGASTSCAAVAIGGEGGLPAQASTFWHEVGHLLGLFHTSEDDGTEWDPIEDTPRCTADQDADDDGYVDENECAAFDGANLMFHDSTKAEITEGQATILRASPLFRP